MGTNASIKAQVANRQPAQDSAPLQDEYKAEYETEQGVRVSLSPTVVWQELVTGGGIPAIQEVMQFIRTCEAYRFNPFTREIMLIMKPAYKTAIILVAKDTFFKRAERNKEEYEGIENGLYVIAKNGDGTVIERLDSFYLPDDKIVGAWARVYRKGYKAPVCSAISFDEYAYYFDEASNNKVMYENWAAMPGTMASKVAQVRALRAAFPNALSGLYIQEERPEAGDMEGTAKQNNEANPTSKQLAPQGKPSANPAIVPQKGNQPPNAVQPAEMVAPTKGGTNITQLAPVPDKDQKPSLDEANPGDEEKIMYITGAQRKMISDVFNGNLQLCKKFVAECGYKNSSEIKAADFNSVFAKAKEAVLRPQYSSPQSRDFKTAV